jgi:DNA-binding MarR family transcriptional regulator
VALDAATSGSVISRLEAKGWIARTADSRDRRRKLLQATPQGLALLERIANAVNQAQQVIVAPLDADDQARFMDLLTRLVSGHDASPDTER